jgi:multidrug efflux system outer membrane protein
MKLFWPALAVASMVLGGCTVGPKYQRPAALGTNEMPAAFEGAATNAALGWKPAAPAAHLPRGVWWEVFGDPELSRLESMATAGNQELAAALARFEQARALFSVARSDFFPHLNGGASYTRQRTSENQAQLGQPAGASYSYNTLSLPFDATWELDLWGRIRNQVKAARAGLTATADDLEAARLSVQAEVATDLFTFRAFNAEYALLEQTAEAYRRSLELTRNRRAGGIVSDLDVSLAETQLKSTEAQLPTVDLQRVNVLHALATLCGQPATGFRVLTSTNDSSPIPDIPSVLPSELLERRPDIAGAERRMAAANANIGVAQAAFYPTVQLGGMAGLQSVSASTWFDWPSRLWAVGPSLEWPLFTGGRLRAQLRGAQAAYAETVAQYRQTVLSAFQEVEDQLAAQRLLAAQLEAENAALAAARHTLEIALNRYKGGLITYLEVVTSQSAALALEQTVVNLRAQRLAASVALAKAMGGGWASDALAKAAP